MAAGSFVVSEAYGPALFGPQTDALLEPPVRERVRALRSGDRYYASQQLPMYQVNPERSGVFYDHNVLAMMDIFVTSGAVRGRYEREPWRFSRQIAFYHALESRFDKLLEFEAGGSGGSLITIYRNPAHAAPFGARQSTPSPPPLQTGLPAALGAQERFYFNYGLNCEAFGKQRGAFDCYEMALRYSTPASGIVTDVAFGMARTLVAMGQPEQADQLLARIEALAPTTEDKKRLRRLRAEMRRR